MEALQSLLTSPNSYVKQLVSVAQNAPHLLIIEGGSPEERFLTSFAYALLLSCSSNVKPCYRCNACLSIAPYHTVREEYTALEKKQKQEYGTYITLSDIIYLNGSDGIYTKQITTLKKHLCDAPRFNKHIVIIEDCHQIHSIKEIANALLKAMEEAMHSIFIITVPERNVLIQTLLSRAFILTLPFITSHTLAIENPWIETLTHFLAHGSGWFAKTISKKECVYEDVTQLILACSTALCEYLYNQPRSPLGRILCTYTPSPSRYIQIIEDAQYALTTNTNPLLIADTLALELYLLLHRKNSTH